MHLLILLKKISNILEYKDKRLDKMFASFVYTLGLFFTVAHLIITKYYGVELVHPMY